MAAKLKNLKITKVDFVDEGANPDANIVLIKRNDGVPDPEPKKGVLRRMMDWFTKNVEKRGDDTETGPDDKPEGAEEELEKSASSFDEELSRRNLDKITDDMWNLCYALNDSLCSIICDEELDAAQKQSAMLTSLDEFAATAKDAVTSWAAGAAAGLVAKTESGEAPNPPVDRVAEELAKGMRRVLDGLPIQKAPEHTEAKGEEPEMRIDKSRLTPEEAAQLEAIEKKAGIPDDTPSNAPVSGGTASGTEGGQEPAPTQKSASAASVAPSEPIPTPVTDDAGDIYKGMTPEAKALMESLRKFKEDVEDSEIRKAASGFEIIGQTPDTLFPVLKNLKASNPAAYEQMLSTLKDAKTAVEKSGAYSELGRTGTGSTERGGAVKEAEAKATELMKSRKGLTRQQAIDEVLQADPELARRYETEE